MGDYIIHGGVRLNKNEIQHKGQTRDADGKKHYIVYFKNGQAMSYTGGTKDATISTWGNNAENSASSVYGVMGLEITGSLKSDNITIFHSQIIGIDVSNDYHENRDRVFIQNSAGVKGRRFLTQATDKNYGDGMVELQSTDSVVTEKSKHIYKKLN